MDKSVTERPQNKHLRPFKKGEIHNPAGRPKLPEEVKATRRLTKTELESIVNKYLWCSYEQIEELLKDKKLCVAEAWLVRIMAKGMSTGNWDGFEWIATRLVGKVENELVIKQKLMAEIAEMPDDQLLQMAQAKLLEGKKDEG